MSGADEDDITLDYVLDSPDFASPQLKEFAARGFVRQNRREPMSEPKSLRERVEAATYIRCHNPTTDDIAYGTPAWSDDIRDELLAALEELDERTNNTFCFWCTELWPNAEIPERHECQQNPLVRERDAALRAKDELAEALRATYEAIFEIREACCSGMAEPPPREDIDRAERAMERAKAALAKAGIP